MERQRQNPTSRIALVTWLSVAVLTALPTLLTLPARAQPPNAERRRIEELAERARERVLALQQEADDLATQEQSLLVELRRVEVERQLNAERLIQIDADLDETTRRLTETAEQAEQLERTVAAQRPAVEARLVELYKLGRPSYNRLLLGVADLQSLGRAYRLVSALAELDRQRITEYRQTLAELRSSQASLEQRQAEVEALQAEALSARRRANRTIAAQSALVSSIDERRDLTAQLTAELQMAHQLLQATLAAMATGDSPSPAPVALPLRPFRGDLAPPVSGEVALPFGRQQQTRFGTTIIRNGIEISASAGSLVKAVHEGQVAFADTFTGFGNLVILDHGGQSYSLYGYLSSLAVERGTHVDDQTILGTVGRAPAGASALYFELRIDGEPVDPVEWLQE